MASLFDSFSTATGLVKKTYKDFSQYLPYKELVSSFQTLQTPQAQAMIKPQVNPLISKISQGAGLKIPYKQAFAPQSLLSSLSLLQKPKYESKFLNLFKKEQQKRLSLEGQPQPTEFISNPVYIWIRNEFKRTQAEAASSIIGGTKRILKGEFTKGAFEVAGGLLEATPIGQATVTGGRVAREEVVSKIPVSEKDYYGQVGKKVLELLTYAAQYIFTAGALTKGAAKAASLISKIKAPTQIFTNAAKAASKQYPKIANTLNLFSKGGLPFAREAVKQGTIMNLLSKGEDVSGGYAMGAAYGGLGLLSSKLPAGRLLEPAFQYFGTYMIEKARGLDDKEAQQYALANALIATGVNVKDIKTVLSEAKVGGKAFWNELANTKDLALSANFAGAFKKLGKAIVEGSKAQSKLRESQNTMESLIQEAKKYKSAEEFVKAQGTLFEKTMYRGESGGGLQVARPEAGNALGEGTYYADLSQASRYGKNITEHKVSLKNPLVIETDQQLRNLSNRTSLYDKDPKVQKKIIEEVRQKIIDMGHDGVVVKMKSYQDSQYLQQLFGHDQVIDYGVKLPSKSQLTDIWNKANKAQSKLRERGFIKTVKESKPKVKISYQAEPKTLPTLDIYDRIRQKAGKKTFTPIVEKAKDLTTSIKDFTGELLTPISTRLKNIAPELKQALRTYEYNLANKRNSDLGIAEKFLNKTNKISTPDWAELDLALKNGDIERVHKIIKTNGVESEFKELKGLLENLYKRAKSVQYDIGYQKDYFPRVIKDYKGFLEYFQKTDEWGIIDQAIKQKETQLSRYLSTEEKAQLVNSMIRGYGSGKITLSAPGATKARTIEIIDDQLNQFYKDSKTALVDYISSMNDNIEARKFFGKELKNLPDGAVNIDDTIGAYTMKLISEGKLSPSQEIELRNILKARFSPSGTRGFVTTFKNLSYIDTMGNALSAVTQIGDMAHTLYRTGFYKTLKHFGKALFKKENIKIEDIGIKRIAEEFNDSSTSAKILDKVFKYTGLNKIDMLGKEMYINSVIEKYRKQAKKPTNEFNRRLKDIFGNETEQVIQDLKSGEITENVKLLAFNELLDIQPVALSEMPEKYLTGGNGRIFYMLKTYTIKQFDIYRKEIFSLMKDHPIEAMKNLITLTGSLMLMNASADVIKDFLLGRKIKFDDLMIDNIVRLFGISKWTVWQARQEGAFTAGMKTILPPAQFIDSVYKDFISLKEKGKITPKTAESVKSIPFVGKFYYWWFGKGAQKTSKKSGFSPSKKFQSFVKSFISDKKENKKLPPLPKL